VGSQWRKWTSHFIFPAERKGKKGKRERDVYCAKKYADNLLFYRKRKWKEKMEFTVVAFFLSLGGKGGREEGRRKSLHAPLLCLRKPKKKGWDFGGGIFERKGRKGGWKVSHPFSSGWKEHFRPENIVIHQASKRTEVMSSNTRR